ncbi:DNA replication/repair protein RecF [Maritalea porphyrae]|uniref:DNA replication/repair protein RecF n=1 Tax=Maritalea porphyrae TaxID=880732 RepID=UPI0022AF93C1|nr:DNA replication/repair protein RecF [Maritalea porphyrae]MCZ4272151.1 DNA replication/repair protein RecF [Maritalea porphyrae]
MAVPRQPPSHYLSRLRLSNFRNYASAALDPDDRHVVLTGPNGAGKTNLLEAISLLGAGRGLRRANFETLALHNGTGGWAVAASVETQYGTVDLGTGLDAGAITGRRVKINGAPARSVDQLGEYLRILWLTPAQDGLFTGPAADRRRFFDRLVLALIPGHGAEVAQFEKAMRQRNKLLDEYGDASWASAIEAQMAAHAAAMHFARLDTIAHLNDLLRLEGSLGFPSAHLELVGQEEMPPFQTSTELEEAYIQLWRQRRQLDRAAGRTTVGPHRADIAVTNIDKQMPANICSTGEQKALLVGLIMAHARLVKQMTFISPLLLLDEIAAHLDANRRASLFELLNALGTQCWMTGTDQILFDSLGADAQFISVQDALLTPL